MSETGTVHIGEGSAEDIAYRLFINIANAEKKTLAGRDVDTDRAWILRTYAQCLRTVNAPHLVEDHLAKYKA